MKVSFDTHALTERFMEELDGMNPHAQKNQTYKTVKRLLGVLEEKINRDLKDSEQWLVAVEGSDGKVSKAIRVVHKVDPIELAGSEILSCLGINAEDDIW